MTVFYRFPSKEAFDAIVAASGSEAKYDDIALSVVGQIPDGGTAPVVDDTGAPVLDVDGVPMEEPTYLPGWHVNAFSAVPGWDEHIVTPAQPVRIFG